MADKRVKINFCTGSSYHGKLNTDGQMDGYGVYHFVDGSVYEGGFKKGEFHGDGVITLPSNFKLRGIFTYGRCNDYDMEFGDGIEYKEHDWDYCVYPDRRFAASIHGGIPPVGIGHETSTSTSRKIPEDYFDVEEGFFNPNYDYIWSAEDLSHRLRVVSPAERKLILKYFRSSKKEPVGFQQDIIDENVLALYELFGRNEPQVSCSTSTNSAETKFYRDDDGLFLSPAEKSEKSSDGTLQNENPSEPAVQTAEKSILPHTL